MKKAYIKPTARSHELRCRSMVAQSLIQEEAKIEIVNPDYDPDDDDDDGTYEPPIWAD